MEVRELLARLEHGQQITYIAKKIGKSRQTLRRNLISLGFHYDKPQNKWIFSPASVGKHEALVMQEDSFPDIEDDFNKELIPPLPPREPLTDLVFKNITSRIKYNNGRNLEHFVNEYWLDQEEVEKRLQEEGYHFNENLGKWEHVKIKVNSFSHNSEVKMNPVSNDSESKVNSTSQVGETKRKGVSSVINSPFTQEEVLNLRKMLDEWQSNKGIVGAQSEESPSFSLHDRIKTIVSEDKVRKTVVINKSISDRLDSFSQSEKVNKSDVIELALMDFIEKYGR